ncbi:uncharacterized protein LOC120413946 [Culex pipiens pallens]|uniref:uncharacterized protein LOC120413946 n=1 Tax=Culex pipiens pallens TaxID=42434 RepID=UPI001954607A|nr:uncharacterized protein LOC120413946 [Culex pipiens pallens]
MTGLSSSWISSSVTICSKIRYATDGKSNRTTAMVQHNNARFEASQQVEQQVERQGHFGVTPPFDVLLVLDLPGRFLPFPRPFRVTCFAGDHQLPWPLPILGVTSSGRASTLRCGSIRT